MRVRTVLSARSIASLLSATIAPGLVHLEREVHAALEVEAPLQRDVADGVVHETPSAPRSRASSPCAGTAPDRTPDDSADDDEYAILQVGHATAGWEVG